MRTFIALDLPAEIRETLAATARRIKDSGVKASWVRPDRMHLTLRFLGDITEDQAVEIGEILARKCFGQIPFTCRISGLGVFPNMRRPSVIWAGVVAGNDVLGKLQQFAEDSAQAIGLAPEKRLFKPHLTLARIRNTGQSEKLANALSQFRDDEVGTFDIRCVTLYSSELTRNGPIYEVLKECVF